MNLFSKQADQLEAMAAELRQLDLPQLPRDSVDIPAAVQRLRAMAGVEVSVNVDAAFWSYAGNPKLEVFWTIYIGQAGSCVAHVAQRRNLSDAVEEVVRMLTEPTPASDGDSVAAALSKQLSEPPGLAEELERA